ncbi:hypothetical protein [Carnimonas bestiolae]|uniref:hypothetical protein n=1 Tax=Carnimonas bestiolae TaxID=3402172 RepID=UPI003EDC36F0
MSAQKNSSASANALTRIDLRTSRHWMQTLIGAILACLLLSLTACAEQRTVTRTVQRPVLQVPSDLTNPLERPNCLFASNRNLGDCILLQQGVIDKADADRRAIRKLLEAQ